VSGLSFNENELMKRGALFVVTNMRFFVDATVFSIEGCETKNAGAFAPANGWVYLIRLRV